MRHGAQQTLLILAMIAMPCEPLLAVSPVCRCGARETSCTSSGIDVADGCHPHPACCHQPQKQTGCQPASSCCGSRDRQTPCQCGCGQQQPRQPAPLTESSKPSVVKLKMIADAGEPLRTVVLSEFGLTADSSQAQADHAAPPLQILFCIWQT